MRYAKLVDGKVEFVNINEEFPQTINAHLLSDEDIAPIMRVEVVHDELGFCEKHGEAILTLDGVVRYPAAPIELEEAKRIGWEHVKEERTARQYGPMPYDFGGEYGVLHSSLGAKALSDLTASVTAALAMAQVAPEALLPWTTDENITVQLAPAAMIAFGLAAIAHYSAIHIASQPVRTAIEEAQTVEEVRLAVEGW